MKEWGIQMQGITIVFKRNGENIDYTHDVFNAVETTFLRG